MWKWESGDSAQLTVGCNRTSDGNHDDNFIVKQHVLKVCFKLILYLTQPVGLDDKSN